MMLKLRRFCGRVGAWLVVALLAATQPARAVDSGRDWDARDSIAVRYVARDLDLPGFLSGGQGSGRIEWSPDRRFFFFITRYGDLSCDCNFHQLNVFSAADLTQALGSGRRRADWQPRPWRSVQFSSSRSDPFFQPIARARWENDHAILFAGVQGGQQNQLYRFDVERDLLQQLTRAKQDVTVYGVRSDSLVYVTSTASRMTALDRYPMLAITGDELFQLAGAPRFKLELWSAHGSKDASSLGTYTSVHFGPWLAPDGKHAIMALLPEGAAIAPEWSNYEISSKHGSESGARFMLIDIEQGRMEPMFDAPTGKATRSGWYSSPDVLWTRDGAHAILINAALPLDPGHPERRSTSYIVDVDIRTGAWFVVDALPRSGRIVEATQAAWVRQDQEFSIALTSYDRNIGNTVRRRYLHRDGRWSARQDAEEQSTSSMVSRQSSRLRVSIRESANDPPVVIASDGKHEIPLTAADPALHGIWRPKLRRVQWREENGRVVGGGLLLPRESAGSAPFPLVIQAYKYDPDVFLPDGTATTAFAAQALVSAGIAVLFLDIPAVDADLTWRKDVVRSPREGESFVQRIDAAVAALAGQGLIAPTQVGLVGFSRSGFNAYYAITHPGKTKLAAAIVADSTTMSYGEYVADAATSVHGGGGEIDQYYGGDFWSNRTTWFEHAPGFNVNRVTTPVLFTFNNRVNGILALETLGAFRLARRPFDLVCFPEGAHQLQLPKERLASMQLTVDWLSFWLLGREQISADKAEQFARWRKVRDDWARRKALTDVGHGASESRVDLGVWP